MTDRQSLLPPNTTELERAFEQSTARIEDVPTPLRSLWRPNDIRAGLLPYLAWSLSVGLLWGRAITEDHRRALVETAHERHAIKGTPASITRTLAAVGLPDSTVIEARTAARQVADTGLLLGHESVEDTVARWFEHWADYALLISPGFGAPLGADVQRLARDVAVVNAPARSRLVRIIYSHRAASTLGFAFAGHASQTTDVEGTARGRRRASGTLGLATALGPGGLSTSGRSAGRQRLTTRAGLASEVTAGRMVSRCGRAAGRARTRAEIGQATTATASESRTVTGTADGARRLRAVSGLATSSQTAESRTATGTADGTRRMRLDRWGAGTAAMTETVHHEQERVLPALYLHTRSEPVHAPDGTTVVTALPGGLAITQGGQTILLGGVQPSQPSFTLIGTATGQAGDDTLTFAASPDVAIGDTVVASAQWHTVIGITSNQVTLDAPLGRDVDAQILRKDS
jgi:phage tail P2-like protein